MRKARWSVTECRGSQAQQPASYWLADGIQERAIYSALAQIFSPVEMSLSASPQMLWLRQAMFGSGLVLELLAIPRITRTSGNGSVDSERTGQSSSGLDEERSWYHLKRSNWVLGLTSTMPRRPTDGCPSAGVAVLGLMVRRGFTPPTNDNWSAHCNGLMHSR